MHVVFRESHGLEESETPTDLGQSPADLVVLSFSDSDLGAFAAAWHRAGDLPGLRLASLAALKHPLSVDTYVEQTLEGAKGILIRLIGGQAYWPYGLAQVEAMARRRGIALAVLPADGRADERLDAASTVPVSTVRRLAHLCDTGGAVAAQAALAQLALAAGLYAGPVRGAKVLPQVGAWTPEHGVCCPLLALDPTNSAPDGPHLPTDPCARPAPTDPCARPAPAPACEGDRNQRSTDGRVGGHAGAGADWAGADGRPVQAKGGPLVLIVFYRAYLTAADLGPVEAMFAALRARGFAVMSLFAPSLKSPDAAGWLARQVRQLAPAAIVNATAFSGIGATGASPLDAADVPVFQIALATSDRAAWAEAERGLSPADLAMHVVLPEVDGRLFAGVASFKEPGTRDPALEYARAAHAAEPERIAAIADRIAAWTALGAAAPGDRRLALVLSTYPGRHWNMAHAVGLDALASAEAILQDLAATGHDCGNDRGQPGGVPGQTHGQCDEQTGSQPAGPAAAAAADLTARLSSDRACWPLADYRAALQHLPAALRDDLATAWGAPEDDPACTDGAFHFAVTRRGAALIALQPERGAPADRGDDYHDLSRTPRHAYVAFYLWLRSQADATIHVGAHGTLEWLPGKAVALSDACWPEALTGAMPVIYPFIVNDPGEAAQAKRRIGAVTLGHVPPPLRTADTPARLTRLEALLDEFSNADGLDPRRRDRLQSDIRDEAQALGVEDDLGLDRASSTAEAITRIDRFVCDVKESQFGDGLHIWGRPSGDPAYDAATRAERAAIPRALAGRRIAPGPSGSPARGRRDVLPTGRNLYTTDPRAVPSRAAYAQGVTLAADLVRRHLQDHGDYPKGLIVDLWGSATMRTAGEEFAMALALIGVRPVWDAGSERVSGIEVLPIAELDRPRLDVTLRVSGLFRDVFPSLSALFAQAVRSLAARDEAADWNPYVGTDRHAVYGPAPGSYGLGMGADLDTYTETARQNAGTAWLAASAWAQDGARITRDADGLRARVAAAEAFVHLQDLPETDLLLAEDYAAHEAGFAAAQSITGGRAALYHLDNTDPARPRTRALSEEIARVVQARAANPDWLAGMRRHGFRGAAEIAATLEHMAAFAHLAGVVGPHLFDAYYLATLGDDDLTAFLGDANPQALQAMRARFAALAEAGLWRTRRNAIAAAMAP